MTDKTITLTVSEKMFEAIAAEAARTGMSMSSTVERKLSLSMFDAPNDIGEETREYIRQRSAMAQSQFWPSSPRPQGYDQSKSQIA